VYNAGDWTGQLTDRPTYDIAQCLADANAKGYSNAGLLNGSECFYTTVRPTTRAPEIDCNSVCPHEPKFGGQYCGGGTTRVSVYGTANCKTALACNGTSDTAPPTGNANIAFPAVPSISVSSPSSGTDVVTITGTGDVNYTVKYGPDNGNYTNSQGPIIGTSATVSSLDPTIFYHFTAYAFNSCGTSGNADAAPTAQTMRPVSNS
jgi:hypothetical protein